MFVIESDFHPSWQQVSWLDLETGEAGDEKVVHEGGSAEEFYRRFPAGSRVGRPPETASGLWNCCTVWGMSCG